MHDAAYTFIARTLAALGGCAGLAVAEVGSYDVNGSVRPLFADAARYVGVDMRPGPGVDVVGDAGILEPGAYDLIVSTEALEHDPDPAATLIAVAAALRSGGALLLTAAAPEREPHGCDGYALPVGEHYGAIHPSALRAWLTDAGFAPALVWHQAGLGDVYAVAWRP
jgi:SAM-dependent methyltransferase